MPTRPPGAYRTELSCDQVGFAMVELAVATAIVGILVALAMPQYQHYIARAQFTEGLNLAAGQKAAVLHAYSQTGECPTDHIDTDNVYRTSLVLPRPEDIRSKYVESVDVRLVPQAAESESGYGESRCTITAGFNEEGVAMPLRGKSVMLSLENSENGIRWDCETTVQEQRYVPSNCRAGREFLYDWAG